MIKRLAALGCHAIRRAQTGLLPAALLVAGTLSATPAFFAMDTGARGEPETVVPMLKELGYSGLGGSPAGCGAMAETLERNGMKLFNVYVALNLSADQPVLSETLRRAVEELKGHDSALWLALTGPAVAEKEMVERLAYLADFAARRGVPIALYPHAGTPLAHVEDCLRLAVKLNRPEVGITFNLCHWLKVEGDRDPEPVLRAALPWLRFVTINGAETGDTKTMGWDRLIQPLDRGGYDVRGLLAKLQRLGYEGPIGLQGFAIPGDQHENLAHSMAAWRSFRSTP